MNNRGETETLFLVILLVGLIFGLYKCTSRQKEDCAEMCAPEQSMYSSGGYGAATCYCQKDDEWKLKKKW